MVNTPLVPSHTVSFPLTIFIASQNSFYRCSYRHHSLLLAFVSQSNWGNDKALWKEYICTRKTHIKTNIDERAARSISINIVTGYTSILKRYVYNCWPKSFDSCINISVFHSLSLSHPLEMRADIYLRRKLYHSVSCVSFSSTLLPKSFLMIYLRTFKLMYRVTNGRERDRNKMTIMLCRGQCEMKQQRNLIDWIARISPSINRKSLSQRATP